MRTDREHLAGKHAWLRQEVEVACRLAPVGACPLDPASIQIVAVSKYLTADQMGEMRAAGLTIFAESRVQQALPKLDELAGSDAAPLEWHFIGSLQRNKAAQVVGRFQLIHSVDRMELAERISQLAAEMGIRQRVLLQVNASGEAQKHGFSPEELERRLPLLLNLPGLAIEGLMGMAALGGGETARHSFRALRQLRDRLDPRVTRLTQLSMGMSGDFAIAVQEGASLIRIGSVLYEE
jgi:pyridoxal phosphate enzyme (YggS family)